eukprot:3762073-Rhodomonas_salina.1
MLIGVPALQSTVSAEVQSEKPAVGVNLSQTEEKWSEGLKIFALNARGEERRWDAGSHSF